MNNLKYKLFLSILVGGFLLPNATQAYSVTAETATKINADTILYTLTYEFGFLNRELLMPFIAKEKFSTTTFPNYVEFALENELGTAVSLASAEALVLTADEDVTVKDGQYHLPEGRSAEFTLLTILKVTDPNTIQNQDLSLQITQLPFTLVDGKKKTLVELKKPELKFYRTSSVTF